MKYDLVPNIISSKDLDYLCDMFNWNYNAYKFSFNALQFCELNEVKDILLKSSNIFYEEMIKILNILNNGGNNE